VIYRCNGAAIRGAGFVKDTTTEFADVAKMSFDELLGVKNVITYGPWDWEQKIFLKYADKDI
jgi:hypothetical protein